jgi:hypothetical protein
MFEEEWGLPFEEYAAEIFNGGAWGDQLLIHCIARALGRSFVLIFDGGAYNPSGER